MSEEINENKYPIFEDDEISGGAYANGGSEREPHGNIDIVGDQPPPGSMLELLQHYIDALIHPNRSRKDD
jgi:hypothetical protein